MPIILLINPNSSAETTGAMLAAASAWVPPGVGVRAVTAAGGPAMILDARALAASEAEVVRLGMETPADAVVVAAFGDPGVVRLRTMLRVPVLGIGEQSLREAAWDGRRFGVATTTPALVGSIEAMVEALGLGRGFTGVRLTAGAPLALAADPPRQEAGLEAAARACIDDGAEAVVIGGGPLSRAAAALEGRLGVPVIQPVPAAFRAAAALLG